MLSLAGCDDDSSAKPTPTSPTPVDPTPTDPEPEPEPVPWDGTYTELEDPGDLVDEGPYDEACRFLAAENPDPAVCEDPSQFDISGCDAAGLAATETTGIYSSLLRIEQRLRDGQPPSNTLAWSAVDFRLFADGTTGTVFRTPLVTRETSNGRFFLLSKRQLPNNTTTTTALMGCHARTPGLITGCFVSCSSNPRTGRTVGTFAAHRMSWHGHEGESSGGLKLVSESSTPVGLPADIYVAKGHAYVVSLAEGPRLGGLSVFDVSDRKHPVLRTTISLPGDNSWNGVWSKGDALYIAANGSGLIVYDISKPAEPVFVRHFETAPYGVHTVLVDGDRLYAMAPSIGTYVYDVTHPLDPVLRTVVSPGTEFALGGPHDSFVYEGRLYISHEFDGYIVMDVSNLDDVRVLGHYPHPDRGYAHHSAVGTFAGRTIAFEGGEFSGAHLRVLDVGAPERIVKMGEFRLRPAASIHNILLKGERLYIAWYQEGLRVLDVSNPTKPTQVAHYNTFRDSDPNRTDNLFEGAIGVRLGDDGTIYVVDTSRGLLIFDEE
ncbi:hypothetical protein LY474_10730 [Myxococcus stipitatus]|uniref:LVIVD repeat-containing protein n=1 Tax=Myxococcus stipitatus TaxID=83455 RepID=UPI001F1F6081|nr:hypothetical protein [Myxococcus stipitatus]MCE9668290.1 hypothetical protein [Myxococcus stipitatus]